MGGKPIVKGTRITVEQVLKLLAQGLSIMEILKDYPHLSKEDISAVFLSKNSKLDNNLRFYT
jgi:uncharacterized protein (DUF433 family)